MRGYWIIILGIILFNGLITTGAEVGDEEEHYVDDENEDDDSVEYFPIITTVPKHIDVVEGDEIKLECKGKHFKNYALIWTKIPDQILSLAGGILSSTAQNNTGRLFHPADDKEGTILIIKNAMLEDAGGYNCTLQWNVTILHHVTVRQKDPGPMKPFITLTPHNIHVLNQDESINLTCLVRTEGKQQEFYWKKKTIHGVSRIKEEAAIFSRPSQITAQSILPLKSISRHEAGDYECVFKDDIGQTESTVRIDINFPPVIETRSDSIHSGLYRQVELRCIVHGQPKPDVKWLKGIKGAREEYVDIKKRPGIDIRTDTHQRNVHILFIHNVSMDDFGTYACDARNGFPKAGIATITLSGNPSQPTINSEKTKMGSEHMSYDLVWKIESTIPIDSNVLRYKEENDEKWTDIDVKATQNPTQPSFYEVSYTLANLTSSSKYEATLLSHNKEGWSVEARPHRFDINGKNYSKLEGENNPGKACGLSGGSLQISIGISILIFIRNWC